MSKKSKKNFEKLIASSRETKWWAKDYGEKKLGTAVSSFWTSKFDECYGGWGWNYVETNETNFSNIISSVRRSANIASNADSPSSLEKEITVKWAVDKECRNTSKDSNVFLSPSVVDKNYTKKPSWTDDERIDVLIGEALVQSTMKRTIDCEVEKAMVSECKTKKGQLSNEIWTISEHLFAEKDVLENYPGFKGYFAANRAYYTGSNVKRSLENSLKSKLDPTKAASALAWELLHPGEPLRNIPENLRKFIEWCKENLSSETTSKGRSEAAIRIANRAFKEFSKDKDDDSPSSADLESKNSSISKMCPNIGVSEFGRDEEIDVRASSAVSENPTETSEKDSHEIPKSLDKSDWARGTIDYKVTESPEAYARIVRNFSNIIQDVRNRLKIRSEEQKMIEHALKKGRLDEGSLYKLAFSRFDYMDEKIFEQEEIISLPDVAFGLLVDESGSMDCWTSSKELRIDAARNVAVIMAEALRDLDGIKLGVWGHTAEGRYHGGRAREELCIHQYYTPENPKISSIARMSACENNLDGYAISYVARQMIKHYSSCKKKVLIHISDGQPSACSYGGYKAQLHVGGISKLVRSEGIHVLGIGIDNAFSDDVGRRMYGEGNYVVLKGLEGFQNIITNVVAKIANERK